MRGAVLALLALGLLSYGLIALGQGHAVVGMGGLVVSLPAAWYFLRSERRTHRTVG